MTHETQSHNCKNDKSDDHNLVAKIDQPIQLNKSFIFNLVYKLKKYLQIQPDELVTV